MRVDRHLTLPDLLALRAAEQAGKTAIVVADVGEITFGEWDRRADATARSLVERGLSPGDPVALVFGERDWVERRRSRRPCTNTRRSPRRPSPGCRTRCSAG
ncbi:hypothetical protein [Herbidospora yilanensis]|uniref:hypothetical protein n=1 Tax=Herbidospora yilanensis TaxID=354426 RepID=UPI001E315464|nr:hypothetical protein [Herbidospora yilanensis]